ncbi:SDR family oxidoreductase, partial [Staphylococcus aureus]
EALTRATERCVDELGAVDILVANAGISDYALMSEGDPARWRRLLEINVLGAAHAIRCVLPGMKQRRRGHVVLMASTAGRTAWVGEPMYIAS